MVCIIFFFQLPFGFIIITSLIENVFGLTSNTTNILLGDCFKGGDHRICLPENYQKYDLPSFTESVRVTIEVHIKDIPKVAFFLEQFINYFFLYFQVSDKDFSITLDSYFNVKWRDARLVSTLFNQDSQTSQEEKFSMTAVNVNILPKLWIPDLEIMDLMSFETHKILSKLEGE